MRVDLAAIVGVGLIGGSLAGAWREAGFAGRIVGVEPDGEAARVALERGLVDDIVDAVPADADIVAICAPSDLVAGEVTKLKDHGGVCFDVGSVKGPIVEALENGTGGLPERFVPAHPIAGAEHSGPAFADASLFQGAVTVLTPTDATSETAVELVTAAWAAAGTTVAMLEPADHDEMLAVTSHLPHLLAFAFMQQVDRSQFEFTGGGFRDFTRIAGANPELWWRILRMNRDAVLAASDAFSANLAVLTEALAGDDAEMGIEALENAAEKRGRYPT